MTLYNRPFVKARGGDSGDEDLTPHTRRTAIKHSFGFQSDKYRTAASDFQLFISQSIKVFRDKLNNSRSWTENQISQSTGPSAQVGVNWALVLSF